MRQDKLVSIIIPVYNVEKYLQQCIISCLSQTYTNVEIIAVDDGSTDMSTDILKKVQKKYNNIKVIHQKNKGVSCARNVGIEASRGDYIAFVDADDYLAKNAIEYMIKLAEDNNSEFVILKNCFSRTGQGQLEEKIINVSNEETVFLLLGLSMELGCWNKMYSRKMLLKNQIFFEEDLFYGEGLHFILKVAQKAKNIVVGNKRVYYYRKNNLKSATSKFYYKKFENGEKSLIRIKDEMKIHTKRIMDIWMFHYCMYAQNVLVSCINNKSDISNYKAIYKMWKKKFKLYFRQTILSNNISLKEKIKLIIIRLSPKLFSMIRCHKLKKNVERSV